MSHAPSWIDRSLNDLLDVSVPSGSAPPLAHRLFRAGAAPIRQLTDADLALLLRQHRGATYLLPVAVERLSANLWADADLYPGHLLVASLRNRGRLGHLQELEARLRDLAEEAHTRIDELDEVDRPLVENELGSLDDNQPHV